MTVRMPFLAMLVVIALIGGTIGCGETEDSREEGSISRSQSGPIPDPNLRLAVRKHLDEQAGLITAHLYLDVDPQTVSVTASEVRCLRGVLTHANSGIQTRSKI